MANVIPMSGSGSRFSAEGYILPKPLIAVSGFPMISHIIDALPPADKWVFIVRKEHIDNYAIDEIILKKVPKAIIVPEENPVGQATSCMLALPHLDPDEDMLVAACDNSFLYDRKKFVGLKNRADAGMIVWTFTKSELLSARPEAWGWVRLGPDGETIADVSVKSPISADPFNDHAVVATFYFRRAREFQEACELMVRDNFRINNEFYLDALPIFYKKMGLRSIIFDVDLYVGWGRPADLHKYEELEYWYFAGSLLNRREGPLWAKFFDDIYKR
jgi:NDP-sugar pyrophosphorylase family protein